MTASEGVQSHVPVVGQCEEEEEKEEKEEEARVDCLVLRVGEGEEEGRKRDGARYKIRTKFPVSEVYRGNKPFMPSLPSARPHAATKFCPSQTPSFESMWV